MLEGICLKCNIRYYGWAMRDPIHQICSNCGSMLVIKRCDGNQFKNCSSNITEQFPINLEKDIFFRNQKTDNDPNNQ